MHERIIPVSHVQLKEETAQTPSDFRMSSTEAFKEKSASFSEKAIDAFVTFCLFMLFFGMPIFFVGDSFQGIVFEKQMYFFFFLFLGLVAWIAKGVLKGGISFRRTPLDIPIAIFWIASLISTVVAVDRWHSFFGMFGDPSRGFLSVTAFVVLYYLVVQHTTKRRLIYFFWALVFSGILVSMWGLLGVMDVRIISDLIAYRVPSLSLMGSISALALFSSAALPLLMVAITSVDFAPGKSSSALSRFVQVVLILIAGLIVFLLLVLHGFVPWISVFVGMSIFLIFILAHVVCFSEKWLWLPGVIFFGILGVFIVGENQLARTQLPIEVSPDASLSWIVAKDSLKEHFFFGSGIDSYQYSFSRFHPESFNSNPLYALRFTEGSSLLFEIISTMGAVGAVAFILLVLSFVSIGLYLLSKNRSSSPLALGVWSSAMIYMASWFFIPTNGPMFLVGMLVCVVAVAILFHESNAEQRGMYFSLTASPKYALPMAFFFLVLASSVVFLFVFAGKIFFADIFMGKASKIASSSPEDAVRLTGKAMELNSKEGYYFIRAAQMYMTLANREAAKPSQERNIEAARGYIENAIQLALKGRDMLPKNVVAEEALAQIYDNAALYVPDALSKAEEGYRKVSELEPANPLFVLKMGQSRFSRARSEEKPENRKPFLEESKKFFERSLELKQDYVFGYFYLALVQDALGDKNNAIENMTKAIKLDPGNIDSAFQLGQLYQSRGEKGDEDIAEKIYTSLLDSNQNNVQVRFALGLLYDHRSNTSAALKEFEKILESLPEEDDSDAIRKEVQTIVNNLQNGRSALAHRTEVFNAEK